MEEAKKVLLKSFPAPETQVRLSVPNACHRILAEPVFSKRTNPPTLLSGPDGIAVKSEETTEAGEDTLIELETPRVNTGMPMPEGYDAVIPIEEVTPVGDGRYRIHTPVSPYQNTIPSGTDVVKEDMVMDKGHYLIPFDIGALLTYGITDVLVKNWTIGLVATGDEIISPFADPAPGQIVDTNSQMIASYLQPYGVSTIQYSPLPDDPVRIASALVSMSQECDMVLLFGGSSAGSKDFTVDALEQVGTLLFHGVAMAPGKPVSLARVNRKPVVGMPGPSIGALTVLHVLLFPLFRQWGIPVPKHTYVKGVLTEELPSFPQFDLFLMMSVQQNNGFTRITPVERKFGQMMGVRADGVLHVKAGSASFAGGQEVEVRLLRNGHDF